VIAPRGAAGEDRLAAMIVDPGQFDTGPALLDRLGPLKDDVHDPAADEMFQRLLEQPGMRALFEPRMATHGVSTVRAYCEDMLRYTDRTPFFGPPCVRVGCVVGPQRSGTGGRCWLRLRS
jgi:hypothetical protein